MLVKLVAFAAAGMLALGAPSAFAVPVGLELQLLLDVSGSVSATEYNLQKQGYVQAFQSATVQSAIASSVGGGIAVSLVQWSGTAEQQASVGFTLVNSAASANAFAAAINAITRPFSGQTAPGSAIDFAVPRFNSNGFEGTRLVLDVSGDGAANQGANTLAARDAASLAGITINGLPILGEVGVQAFYQNSIVTPGGFLEVANSFADFSSAIERKIVREVTNPIPEPATFAILGLGLLVVGVARRRLV